MKTCILRGVPPSLRQDGWWLGPISGAEDIATQPRALHAPRRYTLHALLLAALMAVSQLPMLSDPPELARVLLATACGDAGDFGFHTATGLRSLEPVSHKGTPL